MSNPPPALRPLTIEDRRTLRARCIEVTRQARSTWDMAGLNVFLHLDLKGLAAGQARIRRKKGEAIIRLNPEAFHLDAEQMLQDTIPHEVAHVVAHWTGLGWMHDAGWRRIAIELGATGKRCHTLKLTRARRTTLHVYRGSCGTEVEIGAQAHAKIQRGHRYRVKRTGGVIENAGYIGPRVG